jgi:hypothetical protein
MLQAYSEKSPFIKGIIDAISVRAMKAYKGRGSISPLILDLDTRLRQVVNLTPWVLYPQEVLVPIAWRAGRASGSIWTLKIPLLWAGFESQTLKKVS